MYNDIKEIIAATPDDAIDEYKGTGKTWIFTEYGGRRKSWKNFYSVIYTKPIAEECDQILLDFARLETVIYTNFGLDNEITKSILARHNDEQLTHISPQEIITTYHQRGRDELVNRGLKYFGGEQLPFTRFAPNVAFYYLMTISFFLFEVFKKDVGADIIPLTWYATTFQRHYLDVAGKIVKTGRQIILQVARATWDFLHLDILWVRCISAESFAYVTYTDIISPINKLTHFLVRGIGVYSKNRAAVKNITSAGKDPLLPLHSSWQ